MQDALYRRIENEMWWEGAAERFRRAGGSLRWLAALVTALGVIYLVFRDGMIALVKGLAGLVQ